MSPEDFCKKWGVKRSQLALLLQLSQNAVDHWFSKSPREPPPIVLSRLDEYDAMLEYWTAFEQFKAERFPALNEIFKAHREE